MSPLTMEFCEEESSNGNVAKAEEIKALVPVLCHYAITTAISCFSISIKMLSFLSRSYFPSSVALKRYVYGEANVGLKRVGSSE